MPIEANNQLVYNPRGMKPFDPKPYIFSSSFCFVSSSFLDFIDIYFINNSVFKTDCALLKKKTKLLDSFAHEYMLWKPNV